MIEKAELLRIAEFKGISPRFAELDYFQDIALLNIYRQFGKALAFKGGTCLYKVFQLNRFSEDLDFTAGKGFKSKDFFQRLPKFYEMLDIKSFVRVEEFHKSVSAHLDIEGLFFDGTPKTRATLLFNISIREGTRLPIQRIPYKSLYHEIRTFDLFVMDEKEILAEKVRAVYERAKPRDVYDIWYLLTKRGVSFDERLVNRKLSEKFNSDRFFDKIEEKKISWKRDLGALIAGGLPNFNQVKNEIVEGMTKNIKFLVSNVIEERSDRNYITMKNRI